MYIFRNKNRLFRDRATFKAVYFVFFLQSIKMLLAHGFRHVLLANLQYRFSYDAIGRKDGDTVLLIISLR